MSRRLQNVSIDVDKIPSTPWSFDLTIVAGLELAPLAEALTTVVRERAGAALVYPDLDAGGTKIRVEWQLDRKRRYWWRLGIVLSGVPGRPPAITAYVGPGDAHRGGTITANAEEADAISSEFAAVLAASSARVRGTTGSQRVLFYLELPAPWSLDLDTSLPAYGAQVLSSMIVKPNEACVSAAVVTLREDSKIAAREQAWPLVAEVAAVLTVATGASVRVWTRQPRGFQHPVTDPGTRGKVYPRRFFRRDRVDLRRDFSRRASVIAEVVGRLGSAERDVVQRMLFAYAAGRDVHHRQPTIAAVAYLAVLAAGLKQERCEAAVCGEHGVPARHPVQGERDLIVERLLSRGVVVEDEREDLRRLLGRAYGEQRSAFVHDAQFVHTERSAPRLLGLPTSDSVVSQHWQRRNDLARIESLAQGLVFRELASRAGVVLVGPHVPVSVREHTGFEGVVHTRPHVRLEIRSLTRRPTYIVAEPGAEINVSLSDVVAG